MKLKVLFSILTFLLIGIWVIVLIIAIKKGGILFYSAEGLIIISLFFLFFLYKKVVRPLDTIGNGMDLLKEQDFSSRLSTVNQSEADRIVLVFNRMMDQLKEERMRVREQNHFLDLLVSVSPMGVIILNFDGEISMINQAGLKFLDYDSEIDLKGKTLDQLTSPLGEEISKLGKDDVQSVRLGDAMIYRCSRLSFLDRGFAHPFILIESLTSEVVKAEKKAYEKVIRMIAHEVNNTVAGVTSTLDTVENALQDINDTEDLREVMKVCIDRCFGMSHFITNFANVVKIPEPQFQSVNLNERIEICKKFMENICTNRHIELIMQLCDDKPMVKMDIILFEQVILNIIKNAAESIADNGKIYIKTNNNPISIEIADNGKGICKKVESKLFSPFFSTKPNGQGLGLIFIREVLINHNCTFSLRTYADGLTRFIIHFPISK